MLVRTGGKSLLFEYLYAHHFIESVAPSGDHYCIDIVVPSSDHCCTVAVLPSSDPRFNSSRQQHTPKYKLKVCVINVNGLKGLDKRAAFHAFLHTEQPDVVLGQESKLDSTYSNSEIFPPNYNINVIRNDRDIHGGGVFITARNELDLQRIQLSDNSCPLVLAKLKVEGRPPLNIGSFYRQPNNKLEDLQSLERNIDKLIKNGALPEIIIGGDFNMPSIQWTDTVEIMDNPSYGINTNQKLLDIKDFFGLTQIVKENTRQNNVLDICFVKSPDLYHDTNIIPGISDHEAVTFTINQQARVNYKPPRKIYQFRKADMSKLIERCDDFCQEYTRLSHLSCAAGNWLMLKEGLNTVIDECIPTKLIKEKHNLPWMTQDIKRIIRRRKRARCKTRRTNSDSDWERYRNLTKLMKQKLKIAHTDHVTNIFESDNPRQINKRAYGYIRSLRNDRVGIPSLTTADGRRAETAEDKAEVLQSQFTSVFTKEDTSIPLPTDYKELPTMPNVVIHPNGVKKLLDDLDCNKATGPDLIPTRVLKECSTVLAPILAELFQKSIDTGSIPDDWLTANVVAVFKKGEKHDPSNYRPISLTSVTCKILEHIIYSQIMAHYNRHTFLSDYQHGFRSGYSCETQLLTTIEDIHRGLDSVPCHYDLIILDFAKAFDTVVFNRLLFKLKKSGLNDKLLIWVKSWLTDRTQKVVVDGSHSRKEPVVSGVPQGTVLGPLLFLVYINDINSDIKSTLRLFADDSLLYRQVTSREDQCIIQQDIDQLSKWANLWQMSFNVKKCHVLKIGRSKRTTRNQSQSECVYDMAGVPLTEVEHHPYLGIELDNMLSWDIHLRNTQSKSTRILNMIRRNFTRGTSIDIRKALYTSLVRPHLEYSSAVWDPHHKTKIDNLEKVQNQAARFVTRKYGRTDSVTTMKNELGWNSLQERRFVQRQCVMYKAHNQLTQYALPPYCKAPTRPLRSHHLHSYQTIRAMHDPYLYSYLPRTLRVWSILPAQIACAPSLECFKSRIVTAFGTGTIVIVPPKTIGRSTGAATAGQLLYVC